MERTVASAYLALLADRGVNYLFGNAGTDFAPLVEAYAEAERMGSPVPRPVIATHENLAVAMAHGYAILSRKIPAVMVHVSVGTANIVCGAMNAASENVAMLLTAGRSPITEEGFPGSRDGYIHWAQEMFDQAGLIREMVKWDYELRNGEQLETVLDRALAIAGTEPRGPVYLSLPREVIAAGAPPSIGHRAPIWRSATPAAPDDAAIEEAARMLATARRPLLITANAGRERGAFDLLAELSTRLAIPVVQHRPRYLSLRSSHAMNLGYDPGALVAEADLIVVMECDVPWIPARSAPQPGCKVVHCGYDPLFSRIPIRGFPCDLAITGGPSAVISALMRTLDGRIGESLLAERRRWVGSAKVALDRDRAAARDRTAGQTPIHPVRVSDCLHAAKQPETIIINEYPLRLDHCDFEQPDCYFGSSSASGLGWGAGAALGAKLAAPERDVVAVLGDGAHLFSNPAAVHHASALHRLPVLFIVMNNSMWNAVHRSTMAMYPDGWASKIASPAFVHLKELPAFEQICSAAGGYGERVEDPDTLPGALDRAMSAVKSERRQALLNVVCGTSL